MKTLVYRGNSLRVLKIDNDLGLSAEGFAQILRYSTWAYTEICKSWLSNLNQNLDPPPEFDEELRPTEPTHTHFRVEVRTHQVDLQIDPDV